MGKALAALTLTCALWIATPDADAYSVFAHQDVVDAVWDRDIVPLLHQRFDGITDAEITAARAYAYGGALIQDLGYYPFGSHLFTNLTHYVRTGDFVRALLDGAADANEYAFALGALAHYASDSEGHPLAVNPGVSMTYPKVREKVGPRALYIDAPSRHIMVEFAFDVLRVARGGYAAQAYRDRIGFKVARPALERAVRETYGIELGDLLMSVDLAIGTYRKAVSDTIPELTRLAWRDKRQEIEERSPGITEASFVYAYSLQDYQRDYGTAYKKPGLLSRFFALLLKIVPKVGPFKPLAFEPLAYDVERLFLESAAASRTRYHETIASLRRGQLHLANIDFDTGAPPAPGRNRLADKTYVDLLHKLAGRDVTEVPVAVRHELRTYFAAGERKGGAGASISRRTRRELEVLETRSPRP